MNRRSRAVLWGIVLFTSTLVTDARAQQYTDLLYRGPGSWSSTSYSSVAIPSLEFLRGTMIPAGSTQGQPINRIPRSFQTPKSHNLHLLHYKEPNTLVGDTYNDGRGGLGAHRHLDQEYNINGMLLGNFASGVAFLGTEAQVQAGLSPEGFRGGVGGFADLRAQTTSGFDTGVVGLSGTVEGRVGLGADANANIGLQGGRLGIKDEVGAAHDVGGKVGVDTEVEPGDTGRFIEKTGNNAIRTIKDSAQDVDRWGQQSGKDINRSTKTVTNDVSRAAKKVGRDIKNFGKSIYGSCD